MEQDYFTIDNENQIRDSFKILNHMRREGTLCDITLVTKNVEISAHKNVLASCSPYFLSMFTNFEYKKKEKIELDVNPELLVSMINYMYTSKLTVKKENVKAVLEIAKTLLINGVEKECYKILEQILDPNNCLGIKTISATYGDSKLLAATLSYIDTHFVDVVNSQEFLNLSNDQLSDLISRDTLRPFTEEEVYECIVKWINHDSKGRRKYLRSLMECVRLPFISKTYLKKHIVNNSFLRGDTYCKDLIINALLEDDPEQCPNMKSRQYRKNSEILIAIGGLSIESKNNLEYYDFDIKEWSKVVEMPFSICNASLAAVNRKVYVIGGERSNSGSHAVSMYDITTNSWQDIVSMITKRVEHSVAILNNHIYAIGGRTSNYRNVLNSGEKFDLTTQKWTRIAPMLTNRYQLKVVVLDGILYVVGGWDGNRSLASLECYNERTNSWRNLCSMKERRSSLGVCALDGKIYAIGGWNGVNVLATVEVYDPKTDNWTEITPMSVPRSMAGVAVVDKRIYVVGGKNNTCGALTSVEVYDTLINKWTISPQNMDRARSSHGVTVLERKT